MEVAQIRGYQLYFADLNPQKEETILLIHGHPFDHSMWKYQYGVLQNYRLIVPDLRGYGVSDADFTKIFIEEQALDLALLLDKLDITQVHLVGLSMGGQIIVEFQRLFPSRVKSLIICASTPYAETKEGYKNRLKLAEKINEIGMVKYTKNDIHKYLNLKQNGEKSAVYQHLYQMMINTTVAGAVASHRGRAERRDNFDYLKNINVPTLIIAGEEDYFFSVSAVKEVAQQIPDATFIMISDSGHLPNMECPTQFNTAITTFYKQLV